MFDRLFEPDDDGNLDGPYRFRCSEFINNTNNRFGNFIVLMNTLYSLGLIDAEVSIAMATHFTLIRKTILQKNHFYQ